MTMTPLQAMKQALEALGYGYDAARSTAAFETINKAQADLRTAIVEMEKTEPAGHYCVSYFRGYSGMANTEFQPSIDFAEGTHTLYTHPQQQTVPEGWQLVPKEPTEDMRWAIQGPIDFKDTLGRYKTMLAVAPKLEDKP